jgi:hypothetical protein
MVHQPGHPSGGGGGSGGGGTRPIPIGIPTATAAARARAAAAKAQKQKQAREENSPLSKLDHLKIRSQNVQQSLLENMKASVLASSVVYETGMFNRDHNLYPYLGPPELLLSLITNPAEAKEFVNATPAQLSMLEPLLKFSIVDQDGNSEPVAFSSYSSEENLLNLASLRATQGSTLLKSRRTEGTNVGVRKFSWKYHNLHEGDYVLSANLQLYFGSLSELVNERYMQFLWLDGDPTPLARSLKPKDAGQTDNQKLKNLDDKTYNIGLNGPWMRSASSYDYKKGWTKIFTLASYDDYFSACESLNKRYQAGPFRKLEVECGWSVPKGNKSELMSLFAGGDRGRRDKMNKFLEGVAATQKTIFLNLSDYDIDFAQDGTTTLSINYFGSADVRINSGEKSDVLGTAMSHRTTSDRYWAQEFPMENPAQYGFTMDKLHPGSYLGTQMSNPQAGGARLPRNGLGALPDQVWLSLRGIEADHKYFMLQLEQAKLEAALAVAAPEKKKKIQELEDMLEQIGLASRVMRRIVGPLRYNKFLRALMDSKRIFTARAETKVILQDPKTGLGEVQTRLEFRPWHSSTVSTAKALDAQKARLKAYAESYKAQKTADGTSFKIDKDAIKKLLKNSFDKTQDYTETGVNGYTGRYDVFYTRLGDILAVGIELAGLAAGYEPSFILGSFSPSQAKLKGFTPATASQRNRATAHSAALNWGSQAYGGQNLSDNEEYMMLYDIPISIDYFNEWFMEQVIEKERTQWPFRQFLDALLDLATKLLNFITETKGQLSLDYTVQTLTGKYLMLRRDARHGFAATGKPVDMTAGVAGPASAAVGGGVLSPIDLRSTKDAVAAVTSYTKGGLGMPVDISQGDDLGELFQPLDTYIISAQQMGMGYRTGDRDYDESEGIFHYVLGAERGIAKSFNFIKTDQPYYREMQLERVNNTGRSRALIIPQNIELEMVGNNLHKNGDYIYIDSRSLLGTYANSTLSLGGYYGVYESENEITAQGFTTRVKGIYQASAE